MRHHLLTKMIRTDEDDKESQYVRRKQRIDWNGALSICVIC